MELLTCGGGRVALFESGGRGKGFDVNPGDEVYIPAGFGHAIRNAGNEDLEIMQTWDNGRVEVIDLDKWARASDLLANISPGCRIPRSLD
jgi:oxalate decarboxylase